MSLSSLQVNALHTISEGQTHLVKTGVEAQLDAFKLHSLGQVHLLEKCGRRPGHLLIGHDTEGRHLAKLGLPVGRGENV